MALLDGLRMVLAASRIVAVGRVVAASRITAVGRVVAASRVVVAGRVDVTVGRVDVVV